MLVFEETGKLEYPEKTSRSREEHQQHTEPTYDAGYWNQTRYTLVGGGYVNLFTYLLITMNSTVLILAECRTPVTY